MEWLPSFNWEGVPFSLKSGMNIPSKYGRYFHDHPVGGNFVLYGDKPLGFFEKISLAQKVIYDHVAGQGARRAIRENGCQIVYALQTAHYLYPEIVLAAKDCGLPVVLRMSDFQLVCPAYSMFRDGAPCDLCLDGLYHCLKHKCLKESLPVTAVRLAAMKLQQFMKVNRKTSIFVCPSKFMAETLLRSGIPKSKIIHLPTPVSPDLLEMDYSPVPKSGYALYVGGLYEPKGVLTAVSSAAKYGFPLKVAGDTRAPHFLDLIDKVRSKGGKDIDFVGFADGKKLAGLYKGAGCVIIPSLWYENSPNVLLEAMAFARPVVASNIGSLPETLVDNRTGFLFEPGNEKELSDKVKQLLGNHTQASSFGKEGRERVAKNHSMKKHLDALCRLFEGLL